MKACASADTSGRRMRLIPGRLLTRISVVVVGSLFCSWPHTCRAASPLSADAHRVMFPLVCEATLDAGQSEMGRAKGAYAVRIDVEPPEDGGGWALYVRAERPAFSPLGEGKPSADMLWKLDYESPSAYRPLEDYNALVLARPNGGNETVTIDLSIKVDWCTSPGRYFLGLVFTQLTE